MTAYLTLSTFRTRTTMPAEDVDALEAAYPGFVDARLRRHQAWVEARLAKRYDVPFDAASPPEIVLGWVESLTTLDAYVKRGFNPSSAQDSEFVKAAEAAKAEVLEAADSNEGKFDLPLRQSAPGSTGVTRGGPFGYSEQSPYVAFSVQRDGARDDDERGAGS